MSQNFNNKDISKVREEYDGQITQECHTIIILMKFASNDCEKRKIINLWNFTNLPGVLNPCFPNFFCRASCLFLSNLSLCSGVKPC